MGHRVQLYLGLKPGFCRQSCVVGQVLECLTSDLVLGEHVPLVVVTNNMSRILGPTRERNALQIGVARRHESSVMP